MDGIPNNSEKAKEHTIQIQLSSEVKPVKKSGARKFIELFFKETPEDVGKYLVEKVVIPSLQSLAHDALDKGIYALFHGIKDTPAPSTSNAQERSTLYRQFQKEPASPAIPATMRTAAPVFRIKEFDFETSGDADIVMDALLLILEQERSVSVGRYYDIIGVRPESSEWNWGWTNLDGMKAICNSNGRWEIRFPQVRPIRR